VHDQSYLEIKAWKTRICQSTGRYHRAFRWKIFVPIVERKNAQVLSVAGDVVQLMDMTDYTTFELPIPADYKDRVVEGNEIQYITALGKIRLDMR